ncbi:ABC transporter permease [candidate division KSB1 bacterium]
MIITTIAVNTFKETVRDKVLYSILLFALGFALVSTIISGWSLDQEEKVIQNFGLVIIALFSLVISIFIGIGLVYKEIEKKTIYTIAAKPIARSQFIVGKYIGLLLTLIIVIALMAAGLLLICWLYAGVFNPWLLFAVGMMFFEMAIIIAFALFFSTFTSPVLSGILSIFVFAAGNFSADVKTLGAGVEYGALQPALDFVYYIVPNFELLNYQMHAVHGLPLNVWEVLIGIFYSIAYICVVLFFTVLIFRNRDLK